ncbi:C-C motif chemokine 3-like [Clarias gariepinus]|uniref:C-C motif chemokine 3-like n=1 Tax=Clarias gariepinus TaxID=13013 RepID=UPI00234DBCFF|nr:C-C motif chemokine 3-like [Clarias gariepinus]
MSSHSLLLVLLVLTCLQSFTTAHNNQPTPCCFSYQKNQLLVKRITGYKVTGRACTKPGIIFALQNGRRVCADSSVEWVKKHMKTVDDRQKPSLKQLFVSSPH